MPKDKKKCLIWPFGSDLVRVWATQIFGFLGIWAKNQIMAVTHYLLRVKNSLYKIQRNDIIYKGLLNWVKHSDKNNNYISLRICFFNCPQYMRSQNTVTLMHFMISMTLLAILLPKLFFSVFCWMTDKHFTNVQFDEDCIPCLSFLTNNPNFSYTSPGIAWS